MIAQTTRDLGDIGGNASRHFASQRAARMASTRLELSRWFLIAAVAAAIPGNVATSSAQAAGDDRTIASAIDHAVRSGDFSRAAAALRKLAEQGNAEAQYRLAGLYRLGHGVPQDDASAFRWMKAAAEQNHAAAQFNLARMYLAGHGASADAAAAKAWMQKAAAQRHEEAAKALATNTPEIRALWDIPRRVAEANAQLATASDAARGPA
jgi:TPR repeat protein